MQSISIKDFWDAKLGLTLRPTGEDFEKGTVEIPTENAVPRPGQKP
jgi:hypothetical protein